MEKYTTSFEIDIPMDPAEGRGERIRESEVHRPKKKKRIIPRAVVLVLSIILGIIICGAILFVLAITLFKLENIEYEGVVNSSTVEIKREYFSDEHSDNAIYAWVINQVKEREKIPFVSSVNVYLKNRNSIVASVKEDELSGYVPMADKKYIYFDSKGNVTEISKKLIPGIPVIEGLKITEQEDGTALNTDASKKNTIVELLKYTNEVKFYPDSIVFDRDNTCGFNLGNIFVDLGIADNIRDKINRLPYILPSLEGKRGTVHMEEWGRENSDIVFEQK